MMAPLFSVSLLAWCGGLESEGSLRRPNRLVLLWGTEQLFGTKVRGSWYSCVFCRSEGPTINDRLLLVSQWEDTFWSSMNSILTLGTDEMLLW